MSVSCLHFGQNKGITRINHFFGYSWSAEAKRYPDVRQKEEMEPTVFRVSTRIS